MKLNKQAQIFIFAGLLLVAALILSVNGTLAKASSDLFEFGRQERNELNTKLTSTQAKLKAINLESLTAKKGELERQIVQSTEQRDQVKAMISQPINKSEIIGVLFNTAKAHNIEITRMNLTALSDARLAGLPVSSVTLALAVEGGVPDIAAFITELNTLYTYGAVDKASITNQEIKTGENATAALTLILYSIEGD